MSDIDDLKVKADKGNLEAQKTLGMIYVSENNKEAIKWLRKAALK
jgi:TPR repeat protein